MMHHFQDNKTGAVLWYKFINRKENTADYEEGINHLNAAGVKINGIVCDGIIGLRERLIGYKFQYCQFHQLLTVKKYLTKQPRNCSV